MKIDVNEVIRLHNRLAEINRLPLEQIEWMDGDKKIEVAPDAIADFQFIGLCNVDFVMLEAWRGVDHYCRELKPIKERDYEHALRHA